MHEISLVRSIFNTLEAEFKPAELANLTDIHLKVGVLSNVAPGLMHNAYQAVTESEGRFLSTRLHIEEIPVEIQCDICNEQSSVQNYRFVCAHCGRPSNNVVKGMELLIARVEFSDS